MSVDVFGRQLKESQGIQGPPGIGFHFTADENYDVKNKKLCNLAAPTNPHDAVNLETMQNSIIMGIKNFDEIPEKTKNKIDALEFQVINHMQQIHIVLSKIYYLKDLAEKQNVDFEKVSVNSRVIVIEK